MKLPCYDSPLQHQISVHYHLHCQHVVRINSTTNSWKWVLHTDSIWFPQQAAVKNMYHLAAIISGWLTNRCTKTDTYLTLEGPCIIFAIYIQSNEIHNVVALIKFLLVLRCQLYMFRPDVSARTIVCTYSIYKEAPEDGPLRSETCRADTWVLINT